MEPQKWAELLYTYGPYAVLAIFLWVAPRQLKAWRQLHSKNQSQQIAHGFAAIGSWLIVFIAVFFIYLNWPPITVYAGSLGVYEAEPAKFFSQSPYLYIKSTPTPDGRLNWEYVVVIHQPAEAGEFGFTYQWGADKKEYGDFTLLLDELKQGHVKVTDDPGQPGKLFYHGDSPATPKRPLETADATRFTTPTAETAGFITAAHAQQRPATDVLLKWLDSSDANVRAQARAQLRQLSPAELTQLLSAPGLSDFARDQIQTQLRSRR